MPATAALVSSKDKEAVARRIHYMTTSGVSFDSLGKARTYELFGHAAAGIAFALGVSREKAEEMLLAAVK